MDFHFAYSCMYLEMLLFLSLSPCAAAMQIYGTIDPVDLSKKTRQQLMHNYE